MLRKNFPGRVKARRIGALERMERKAFKGATFDDSLRTPNQYTLEVVTLQERIELGAPARGNSGKGKRPRSGRRRAIA